MAIKVKLQGNMSWKLIRRLFKSAAMQKQKNLSVITDYIPKHDSPC